MDAAWKLQGELELRSSPWNTILRDEFMRGESTEWQRGGGGGDGRRRARLRPARVEEEVEWRCCEWAWEERRTRWMQGGLGSAESSERRGTSSWSCSKEDHEEESEKREDANDSNASESELSRRRSGVDARSDA